MSNEYYYVIQARKRRRVAAPVDLVADVDAETGRSDLKESLRMTKRC